MLRRVALAVTDRSEEHIASNIKVEGIRDIGTTLLQRASVASYCYRCLPITATLMMVAISSS
jgi:hypothetical protein